MAVRLPPAEFVEQHRRKMAERAELEKVKHALVLELCLWSFDMCKQDTAGAPMHADLISDEAKIGYKHFVGDGMCMACHSGPTFSNLEFHNLFWVIIGVLHISSSRKSQIFQRTSIWFVRNRHGTHPEQ